MTDRSPIHVLCATNAAYAMPLAVMLTSLVFHFKGLRDLYLHIFGTDIPEPLRTKVEASVLQNKKGSYRLEFHWRKLDMGFFENLPDNPNGPKYISLETYSRLLAPDALPADCDRAVYLDCDLVVLKDISALVDFVDDKHTLSAAVAVDYPYVSSFHYNSNGAVIFNYAELGIPATNPYFNAGVLVINLQRWREQKVSARVVEYLERHREKSLYHDQGALNAVLHDQWSALEPRWNWILFNPENWKPPAFSQEDWRKVMRDPCIVHFAGSDKPWKPSFNRPRSSYFRRYLMKTLFKDEVKMPSSALLESIIGCGNYYLLWKWKRHLAAVFAKRAH